MIFIASEHNDPVCMLFSYLIGQLTEHRILRKQLIDLIILARTAKARDDDDEIEIFDPRVARAHTGELLAVTLEVTLEPAALGLHGMLGLCQCDVQWSTTPNPSC